MEEKKQIKVSLGTVICIFIIILLIVALGAVYYLGFIKSNQKVNNIEVEKKAIETQKNELEKQVSSLQEDLNKINESWEERENTIEEQENEKYEIHEADSNIAILSNSEVQSILGPNEATFCIENIEKNGADYIITAYILENESRIISKTEYETLKNGGEITFRNQKWKMSAQDYGTGDNWEYIKSGNDALALSYNSNTEKGFLENLAGIASEGLNDYSEKEIKFKVSKDILMGEFWCGFEYDSNGKITINTEEAETDKSISFQRLLRLSEGCKGSYDECVAYVKNGVVGAIKIFAK